MAIPIGTGTSTTTPTVTDFTVAITVAITDIIEAIDITLATGAAMVGSTTESRIRSDHNDTHTLDEMHPDQSDTTTH